MNGKILNNLIGQSEKKLDNYTKKDQVEKISKEN